MRRTALLLVILGAAMCVSRAAWGTEPTDAGASDATLWESRGETGEMQALKEHMHAIEEKLDEQGKEIEALQKESVASKLKLKELSAAIQFSGFFDVSVSTFDNHPNVFDVGTFEFDIKKEFSKYFQVGAALVFADKQSDLAVGFIDFHLFGGLIPARGNIFLESGFHLQIGKFDVPFGNDWQYYASLDRPTMSAPLTTSILMGGGYNDAGFRVLGNHNFINYVGYVLKGAGDGIVAGGRLAFVPFNNPFTTRGMDTQPLDVGFGYLHDFSKKGVTEQRTFAVDVEARLDFLHLQAEYYRRRDLLMGLRLDGYQVSLFGSFLNDGPLPFGTCVRYDTVHSQADDGSVDERLNRMTLGIFIRPFDVTVLKLEYLHYFKGNEETRGDSIFGQLVIGFK